MLMQVAQHGVDHEIGVCFGGVGGVSDGQHATAAAVAGGGCGVLLGDVRQLVGEQVLAGAGRGAVAAGGEVDVPAEGECGGLHLE